MSSLTRQFRPAAIPSAAEQLRAEVRAFLGDALTGMSPVERAKSWGGYDAVFSRKLGARGWIGMTLPRRYGGQDAGIFSRYVIIEELLAAGAPVAAHWIADRQSGPLLLRYGTEEQKQRILPAICRGELFMCIGMSEPSSGSDLASVESRARRDGDAWVLSGRKLWTTYAHRSHYMIGLFRTSDKSSERHAGLSQFLIDLSAPGVSVRPIRDLSGAEHFNEVLFDDVRLGPDALIGREGNGWEQVMAELAFERSGPERFLSSIALIKTLIDAIGAAPDTAQARGVGRLVARLAALRSMSLAVTGQLDRGENPTWAASVVKDIGTSFEQEIPEMARLLLDIEPSADGGTDHALVLGLLLQTAPSFSLRGGTREILRGIVARGLGLR
ncbi:acyl-CoA dehydrogenase family protein [Sphingomonas oligophenolica]|uniref:Acyl-CoA dehydrogenase family protein n=1 Tax=Sphingomonas oligophenolica TaxID=301154 RepID=A0ABU9Y6B4_9SPHN